MQLISKASAAILGLAALIGALYKIADVWQGFSQRQASKQACQEIHQVYDAQRDRISSIDGEGKTNIELVRAHLDAYREYRKHISSINTTDDDLASLRDAWASEVIGTVQGLDDIENRGKITSEDKEQLQKLIDGRNMAIISDIESHCRLELRG